MAVLVNPPCLRGPEKGKMAKASFFSTNVKREAEEKREGREKHSFGLSASM